MKNNKIARVSQLYNKNQYVVECDNEIYFQSYKSLIAIIDNQGTIYIGQDWDYSKTTLKHLYLFINDYTRLTPPSNGFKNWVLKNILRGRFKRFERTTK